MARKRKPTVDDLYDHRNDPESRNLTIEEATLFEAARSAIKVLRQTFETWIIVGKAVVAARARADRLGGGKTFQRIMEQQGLGKQILRPSTSSLLLRIMQRLPEVVAWHSSLTDQQQIAWAAPTTIVKHCPAFAKAGAAKATRPIQRVRLEVALDALLDHLHEMEPKKRFAVFDRVLKPFGFHAAMELIAAPKRKVAR